MIEELKSDPYLPSLRLGQAKAGDTFSRVLPFGVGIHVTHYTVERVLKRDVVCRDDQGGECRFNLNSTISSAFASKTDPRLQSLIQEEERRRLRLRAAAIAERVSRGRGERIDDDLLQALLAYDERHHACFNLAA